MDKFFVMKREQSRDNLTFDEFLATIDDPEEREAVLKDAQNSAYWFFEERGNETPPGRQLLDTQTGQSIARSNWEKTHPRS